FARVPEGELGLGDSAVGVRNALQADQLAPAEVRVLKEQRVVAAKRAEELLRLFDRSGSFIRRVVRLEGPGKQVELRLPVGRLTLLDELPQRELEPDRFVVVYGPRLSIAVIPAEQLLDV